MTDAKPLELYRFDLELTHDLRIEQETLEIIPLIVSAFTELVGDIRRNGYKIWVSGESIGGLHMSIIAQPNNQNQGVEDLERLVLESRLPYYYHTKYSGFL